MFFVSQKIHIKRSPNAIKIYGDLLWNLCDFWEVESTQTGDHRAHNPPGRALGPRRTLVSCALLERWLEPIFWRKKDNLWKNHVKISAQSELRISGNLRNREGPDLGERETEEDRETDPASEGLSPLHSHGGHGPEGEPSSHLGGGQGRRRRRGLSPPSPVAPECRRGQGL